MSKSYRIKVEPIWAMWEKVRHMRALWLTLFFATACAHQPPPPVAAAPVEEVAPQPPPPDEETWVRVVARRPVHSKFVGKVSVTANDGDFVEAAKVVRAK